MNEQLLIDTLYSARQSLRIKALESLLEGLNDSFDENPPHGKWIEQIKTLEKLIALEKSN